MPTWPAALQNAIVTVATLFIATAAVEGGARLLDAAAPAPPRSWAEHRLRVPPPYEKAPYDVAGIVDEARAIKWQTSPDFGWLPEDRLGRYINITDRRRKTTAAPQESARRIWMFGGSTMMSVEVPDALTIPSAFQEHIKALIPTAKVENLGATTITSSHQLFKLRNMTPVKEGDIVVFYDGVNDVIQSLYYENPHGTMVEANQRAIESLSISQRLIWWIHSTFGDYSSFVRRFINPTSPAYVRVQITDEAIRGLSDNYLATIRAAAAFAQSRSASFFHFVQPNIYTLNRHSPYEQALMQNGWLYPTNLKDVYAVGQPALQQASRSAAEVGISSTDLSGVLDGRQREIFLDFCHVNEHGNELIARAIFDVIKITLKPLPLD